MRLALGERLRATLSRDPGRPSGPWLERAICGAGRRVAGAAGCDDRARCSNVSASRARSSSAHSWAGSGRSRDWRSTIPTRVAGLVLLAPVSHPWPGGVAWYYHVAAAPLIGPLFACTHGAAGWRRAAATRVSRWCSRRRRRPPDYVERAGDRAGAAAGRVPRQCARRCRHQRPSSPRKRRAIRRSSAPTIIIAGDRDTIVVDRASIARSALAGGAAACQARSCSQGVGHMRAPRGAGPVSSRRSIEVVGAQGAGLRTDSHRSAGSEPDERDAQHVGGAGVPSGTPATMMTRWPALAKPSLKAMRQARSTMSSRSWASSATTQCTPQTSDSRRAVARLGEIATIGDFGRSRATRNAVEPEEVQQTMAARSSVSAIWRAAAAMASAPVASGSVRCAWMMRAVDRIALDLLGDAVHGRDRLDRILAGRRFGRQHHGVGALEDRGRDVGDFGARRHRARDHRFEHLRRDHDRLAGAARRRA